MKKFQYMILLVTVIALFTGCKKGTEEPAKKEPEQPIKTEVVYEELTDKELEVYGIDGDEKAQMELANRYDYGTAETGTNFMQAQIWYDMAAQQGNVDALRCLGYLQLNGCLGRVDLESAMSYFEQAIEAGDLDANVGIARTYLAGYEEETSDQDVKEEQDDSPQDKALAYIRKAYEAGRPAGIYYMAYCLDEGIGTEADYLEAKTLYEKVMTLEDLSIYDKYLVDAARTRLGAMYIEEKGVEQDYEKAQEYFEASAENEYPMAMYYMGMLYEKGNGVDKDFEKAIEWYTKAAEKDYAPALNQLGYLYYKGYGVDADIEQALYYQKQAAMQGYAPSQINLGYLYENGIGVEKNLETALLYYQMAAEQNSEGAKEAVARVQKNIDEK